MNGKGCIDMSIRQIVSDSQAYYSDLLEGYLGCSRQSLGAFEPNIRAFKG